MNSTISYLKKISKSMSLISNKELEEFWATFKNQMQLTETVDSDYVTLYSAVKESNLNRGVVKRLGKDELVRTKIINNKDLVYCMLDVKVFSTFLSYFDLAKDKEIIQEIDLQGTGNTKLTVIDGRKSRDGKGLAQYQAEVILGVTKNIMANYYDITPKQNIEVPSNLKI